MKCGLHYIILSWETNWHLKHPSSYCPECGHHETNSKLMSCEPSEKQIFERVFGDETKDIVRTQFI
jgi:hypothetical protein